VLLHSARVEPEGRQRPDSDALPGRRAVAWVLGGGALVTTAAYAILRMAYVDYYAELGVSPEQVGIDRTTVMVSVIPEVVAGVALMGAVLAVAVVVLLASGGILIGMVSGALGRPLRPPSRRSVAIIGLVVVVLWTPFVVWSTAGQGRAIGLCAARGYPASGMYEPNLPRFIGDALAPRFTANPSQLFQLVDGRLQPLLDGHVVMHLGTADGQVVVFDVTNHTSVLAPAGGIVVQSTNPVIDHNAACDARLEAAD
jgi:hypothetical protein